MLTHTRLQFNKIENTWHLIIVTDVYILLLVLPTHDWNIEYFKNKRNFNFSHLTQPPPLNILKIKEISTSRLTQPPPPLIVSSSHCSQPCLTLSMSLATMDHVTFLIHTPIISFQLIFLKNEKGKKGLHLYFSLSLAITYQLTSSCWLASYYFSFSLGIASNLNTILFIIFIIVP